MQPITESRDVPWPKTFNKSSIPKEIVEHIETKSSYFLTYSALINSRTFKAVFIVDQQHAPSHASVYADYFERMIVWVYIAQKYTSSRCNNSHTVFLYMTPFEKKLPMSNIDTIDQIHRKYRVHLYVSRKTIRDCHFSFRRVVQSVHSRDVSFVFS